MKKLHASYVYDNPIPQLRSRQSAFVQCIELPDGRLLATHVLGEAFESADQTAYISESTDGGRTWSASWQAFPVRKGKDGIPESGGGKLTYLPDGRLLMFGYKMQRSDPDLPAASPVTGGVLKDKVFYCISEDGGRTWSEDVEVPTTWVASTEASAPIYILQDGSWATPISGFPTWDGTMVSRLCGRLLRSYDNGQTWNDDTVCLEFPGDTVTCYEQRMCQLEDGTLVVIGWNEDTKTGERLHNHVAFSFDNGKTFSAPVDTGIQGQASSIMALEGTRVLSLHALRRDTDEPGIYACIADVAGGQWKQESFERIWAPVVPMTKDNRFAEIFSFLKFGQPAAIRLRDGNLLMYHWVCEEGCYKSCATLYSF